MIKLLGLQARELWWKLVRYSSSVIIKLCDEIVILTATHRQYTEEAEEADDIYDYSNQKEHSGTISHDLPLFKR